MAWLPFNVGQCAIYKKANKKIIPIDIHINQDDFL